MVAPSHRIRKHRITGNPLVSKTSVSARDLNVRIVLLPPKSSLTYGECSVMVAQKAVNLLEWFRIPSFTPKIFDADVAQ